MFKETKVEGWVHYIRSTPNGRWRIRNPDCMEAYEFKANFQR